MKGFFSHYLHNLFIIPTLLLLLLPSAPLPKLKEIEKVNILYMFFDISTSRLKKN